ncbi:putative cytokinetic ring protein SteA [Thermoanaerobacter uzonensis]|uniref:putative cytokinetic ring protein SteA n=1 Tax=Thermoanaerobacter uzonensis TaxID=447593 RepID=UPI003D7694C0
MQITGTIKMDKRTKNLVKRLNPGEIAIIDHRDIDEVAAESLVEKKVLAVINADKSISGRYPNIGPSILCEAGIPIIDDVGKDIFDLLKENDKITIIDNEIYKDGVFIKRGKLLTKDVINYKLQESRENIGVELDKFIENTLEYAKKEKYFILGGVELPNIKTRFKNRHALVVVRGKDYKEDLFTIKQYINDVKPILIGVDGGADALLEFGLIPDIVIGDMDSVSDEALKKAREIVVHAYPDGRAPGLERVTALGLKAEIFKAPGTSEDIAMLLAFEKGADLIVAVGTHSSMIDFLEKGRKGMSSTFLVRLKVGEKLIDAKGVNKLYRETFKISYIFSIILAALIPLGVIAYFSPPMQQLLKLLQLRIRLLIGF